MSRSHRTTRRPIGLVGLHGAPTQGELEEDYRNKGWRYQSLKRWYQRQQGIELIRKAARLGHRWALLQHPADERQMASLLESDPLVYHVHRALGKRNYAKSGVLGSTAALRLKNFESRRKSAQLAKSLADADGIQIDIDEILATIDGMKRVIEHAKRNWPIYAHSGDSERSTQDL